MGTTRNDLGWLFKSLLHALTVKREGGVEEGPRGANKWTRSTRPGPCAPIRAKTFCSSSALAHAQGGEVLFQAFAEFDAHDGPAPVHPAA